MAIDTFQQEQDRLAEEARIKAGTPKPQEDKLTLRDIMHDDRQNALLGDMITSGGNISDKEIMERFVTGKMEARDIDRLSEIRTEFSEKMRKAESIQSEITPELIQMIAKNNPDLQKIIGIASPDGIKKIFHETIKKIAVTDPGTFDQISRQVETIKSYCSGDYKKLDDEIVKKCKDNNWNVDAYMKALAITDPGERQKALVKVVEKGWEAGGFSGSVAELANYLSFGILAKKAAKDGVEGDDLKISNALTILAGHKNVLGNVLAGSIAGNNDLLAALSRETVGAPKKKESGGMNEVKAEMPTNEKMMQDFKEWRKRNNITDRAWKQLGDPQKDPHRDDFMDNYIVDKKRNDIRGKGGFWASIFSGNFFLDQFFNNFDRKTLN